LINEYYKCYCATSTPETAQGVHSPPWREKVAEDYEIQELIQRDVYVGEKLVGVVVGSRFHPRDEFVKSMRIKVEDGVASEFMRKPAECAPLAKELVHSIRPDGCIRLSKSMRELQRRWRNTVRISEELYAPDELMDRAVLDNDGMDIGNVVDMVKIKRTYKGLKIKPHFMVRAKHGLPEAIVVPCGQLARTTARLDEVILKCSFSRLVTLPSFLKLNGDKQNTD
jgi:sporulation protein YlmC with PRC-barrel domain